MNDPTPRQVRWLAFLAMYDLDIRHIPGTTNSAADALSRLCPVLAEETSWENVYKADPWILENFYTRRKQLKNPLCWHNGRIWVDDRILVPTSLTTRVISDHHCSILSGHWGTQNTIDIVAVVHISSHASFGERFCAHM